jgi:hypothetical protein
MPVTAKLLAVAVSCPLLNVFLAAAQQTGPSRNRPIERVDRNNPSILHLQ